MSASAQGDRYRKASLKGMVNVAVATGAQTGGGQQRTGRTQGGNVGRTVEANGRKTGRRCEADRVETSGWAQRENVLLGI